MQQIVHFSKITGQGRLFGKKPRIIDSPPRCVMKANGTPMSDLFGFDPILSVSAVYKLRLLRN
jgi:hypothetical protein